MKLSKKASILVGLLVLAIPIGAAAVSMTTTYIEIQGFAVTLPITTTTNLNATDTIRWADLIEGQIMNSIDNETVCNVGSQAYNLYIAGENLYVANGSCPTSNTLHITNFQFNWDGSWQPMERLDINQGCSGQVCRATGPNFIKILQPGECITVQYRLNVPSPCYGTISGGAIHYITPY